MGVKYVNDINSKKKIDQIDREPNGAIFMLRCSELNLSVEDLDDMTMGMVYDMMTERANDHEKYDIKAKPGTLAGFFRGEIKYGEH